MRWLVNHKNWDLASFCVASQSHGRTRDDVVMVTSILVLLVPNLGAEAFLASDFLSGYIHLSLCIVVA
jgi:hypothetical protein